MTRIRRTTTIATAAAMCAAGLIGVASPSFALAQDIGTPGKTVPASSHYDTLTYTDGTTVTITSTGDSASQGFGGYQSLHDMKMAANGYDGSWWGGVGNFEAVYDPASVKSSQGITMGWQANPTACGFGSQGAANTAIVNAYAAASQIACNHRGTITFTFSRPVHNAVFNIMNLGANQWWNNGSNGCDIASTESVYTRLALTSGQTLKEVATGGNFQVRNNEISEIEQVGTGIPRVRTDLEVVTATGCYPSTSDLAPQTAEGRSYYGTGSGSVMVEGTYSSVTFESALDVTPVFYAVGQTKQFENWIDWFSIQVNVPAIQPPVAKPEAQTDYVNVPQTYKLAPEFTSDPATSTDTSSLRLCSEAEAAATPVVCTQTKVIIDGEGTYEITDAANWTVVFTPATDYLGTVKKPVTYQAKDVLGQEAHSTITPTMIPRPAPTPTPDQAQEPVQALDLPGKVKPHVRTTLIKHTVVTNADQNAKVRVTCTSASRILPGGDVVDRCTVTRTKSGKVSVKVNSTPTKVTVHVSAPATTGYTAYHDAKTYTVK